MKLTSKNKKLQINLALNYGSKDEILRSFKIVKKKKMAINIKNIEKNFYTADSPDPDILIRTGNTNRLSNFLLWQLSILKSFLSENSGLTLIRVILIKYSIDLKK